MADIKVIVRGNGPFRIEGDDIRICDEGGTGLRPVAGGPWSRSAAAASRRTSRSATAPTPRSASSPSPWPATCRRRRPSRRRREAEMSPRRSGILLHPTSLPGPLRHRRAGARGPPLRGLPGRRRPAPLAGAAARPDRLRRLALPVLLRLRRQPAAHQPGGAGRGRAGSRPRTSRMRRRSRQDAVDYEAVAAFKLPLLDRAFGRFEAGARAADREAFDAFRRGQRVVARRLRPLHGRQGGARRRPSWTEWEPRTSRGGSRRPWTAGGDGAAGRRPRARVRPVPLLPPVAARCSDHCRGARRRAHGRHPDLRRRRQRRRVVAPRAVPARGGRAADGRGRRAAGLLQRHRPALGQPALRLGRRWRAPATPGGSTRFRAALGLVDLVRLDHFRGFEAYWEVPAGETTAVNGQWVKGPGAALFEALRAGAGRPAHRGREPGRDHAGGGGAARAVRLPGDGHPPVRLRQRPRGREFLPHNYPRNRVVYTGTHDNDTTVGLVDERGVRATARAAPDEVREEHEHALAYLDAEGREIHWAFIRAALASVADTAIVPLQDVLGLGSEARMNLPGRARGNWRWRFTAGVPDRRDPRSVEAAGRAVRADGSDTRGRSKGLVLGCVSFSARTPAPRPAPAGPGRRRASSARPRRGPGWRRPGRRGARPPGPGPGGSRRRRRRARASAGP